MKRAIIKATILLSLLAATGCSEQPQSISEQIQSAEKAKKMTLLIVGDEQNPADSIAMIVKSAPLESVAIVEMCASENAELMAKYELEEIPLPLILILSDRGLVMGGLLKEDISAESLAESIPTIGFCDIAYNLEHGKAAIVVVSQRSFSRDKEAKKICQAAISKLGERASIVEVDASNNSEGVLFTMLGISHPITDSYVAVINSQGYITASYASSLPIEQELIMACQQPHVHDASCGHAH